MFSKDTMSKKSKTPLVSNDMWFPAKKRGYGWGLPVKWQGWATLVTVLVIGLTPLLYVSFIYKGDQYCQNVISQKIQTTCDPNIGSTVYLMSAVFWLTACTLIFIQICTQKGEPIKWRNPNKEKHAAKS